MSGEAGGAFAELSNVEVSVLYDMADEWADRDRHGLLRTENAYDDEEIGAFSALYEDIHTEARRRRIIY